MFSTLGRKPKHFFLACGTASGPTDLNTFDRALRNAGIGDFNLVKLSSILPPKVTLSSQEEFKRSGPPNGDYLPIAFGSQVEYVAELRKDLTVIIFAAVAVGVPRDNRRSGLIMEYSGKTTFRTRTRDAPSEYSSPRARVKQMVRIGMADRGFADSEYDIVAEQALYTTEKGDYENAYGCAFAGVVLF